MNDSEDYITRLKQKAEQARRLQEWWRASVSALHNLQDFTDPVAYLDCYTADTDLLTVLTGQEGEHWLRWFLPPAFFRPWHWS